MSVTQLDDFMSLMVKSVSNSDACDSQVSKLNWLAREPVLNSPVVRGTSAVDAPNWRETLHRLAANHSSLQKIAHGRTLRRSSMSNERSRRGQVRQNRDNGKGAKPYKKEAATSTFLKEMESGIGSNMSVCLQYSPVVSLCDILKLKPNDIAKDKSPPSLEKDQYLNYLNLLSNSESQCIHVDKGEVNRYTMSHPRTLINCPHVPFSSDLGIKLTKDWHAIPPETHIRKLERLERYIRPNLFNIRHATDGPFEVIYNKNSDSDHIYKFPTKTYRSQDNLSRKARLLLKHYCKPCTVNLTKLEHLQIASKSISSGYTTTEAEIMSEQNCQKENVEQKFDLNMEVRIVLTDRLRENNTMYKCFTDTNAALTLPSQNAGIPKSFGPSSDLPMHQQPAGRLRNAILKTLTPRNENSVGTTVSIKKSTEPLTKCENLINASVILTPINDFFELQRSVPKLKKIRSDDMDSSANQNHNSKKAKLRRVEKKRGNIYYPRRISPRLNLITNNSPVKVM